MSDKTKTKDILRLFGLVSAAVVLIVCCIVKIEGLSAEAVKTLGVLVATLLLLVFETFNVCVSCMLSCALLFCCGCVGSIGAAFSGYSNHILYFTTASFGISLAFQKSQLSKRLLSTVIRGKRLTFKKLILMFMICAAVLSSIMSNVAAVVIFIPFAEELISYFADDDKKARSRRTMMICLTVSTMIGGMITPAGSSMNLICLDMLEKYAGESVRFIDWIIIGLPMAAIMLIAAFFVITRVYPPEELTEDELNGYLANTSEKSRFTSKDIYTAAVIFTIVALWLISSWIPAINITVVAIAGLALLFLPKFSVMTWEEFSASISWGTFFVAGSLISVAAAVTSTGLCDYFVSLIFPENALMPDLVAVMLVAAVTFVVMALLPSAPAVISILSPIIIGFADNNGTSAVMLVMACALCVSNIYLFPLDAPLVVAYDRKAFKMFELPKATIWLQLIMIAAVSLWMPTIFGIIT